MNRSEGNVGEASAAGVAEDRTDSANSISASEATEVAPNTSTFRALAPAMSDSAFGASKQAPSNRPSPPGSRVRFDPAAVARYEKAGWEANYDRRWGRASLATLHAALFDLPEADMRRSAEHRAWAAVAVDRITSRQTTDITEDWRIVMHELESAYRAVKSVIDRAAGTV